MNKLICVFLMSFLSISAFSQGMMRKENSSKEHEYKNVVVYRLRHHNDKLNVTAIALYKNHIYYLKDASKRMIYSPFSYHSARVIKRAQLLRLLKSIDVNSLRPITGANCECKGYTENRFIIRDLSKNPIDEISVNEMFLCDRTSICNIIQKLRIEFEEINNL